MSEIKLGTGQNVAQSGLPKHWKQYLKELKQQRDSFDANLKQYEKKLVKKHKSLPWYRKLLWSGPLGTFEWRVLEYGMRNIPANYYDDPKLEDYYQWLIDTGRE